MEVYFLQFLVFALALVIVQANEMRRYSSTPERALFGYSSAEDCLFGASSVLTRNVRFTGDDNLTSFGANEQERKPEERGDAAPRPAFIVMAKPSDGL